MYLVYTRNKEAGSSTLLQNAYQTQHPSFKQQFNGDFPFISDEAGNAIVGFKIIPRDWIDQGVRLLGLDLLKNTRYSKEKRPKLEIIDGSNLEGGRRVLQWERFRVWQEKNQNQRIAKEWATRLVKRPLLKDSSIEVLTWWLVDTDPPCDNMLELLGRSWRSVQLVVARSRQQMLCPTG